ncbi:MAG TPA: TolC family protein [Steroidobacteraceae bacterium]|nr:TolC family protein [Steroidobacteraceae bacterium]
MSSPSTPAHFRLAALALAALLLAGAANAQAPPVKRVADALVAEALASSLGLAANAASVEQKQAALDAVRAEYLPQLDLQLRYTEADGGRTIEIPALGLDFRFLREREQDSVLRLTQPLFDARLAALRQGAAHDSDAARHGLAAYRAALARDVRQAYYRWLAAREAIGVLQATAALARENERVNDSLHRNGKVTRDLLLRAEAERLEVEQQLVRARATESLARRYLNLLCNAPLEREPEAAAVSDADLPLLAAGIPARNGARLEEAALSARAELRQLDAGLAAAGASERAARAAFKPQLALAVDAGTQGADWGYDDHDPYVLASLVVRFNLFNGGGDRAALRGARARSAELEAGRALAEQRIRIEVLEALTGLEVAEATLATAGRRVEAATAAYAIVAKKRDLGQVSPAEYLDAQRTLTEARLNGNVTRFEALAALAQVEYAIGAVEQQP